jgi:hypothetical protein
VLHSATTVGCYGFTYSSDKTNDSKLQFGKLQGDSFIPENNKQLNFDLIVTPDKGRK